MPLSKNTRIILNQPTLPCDNLVPDVDDMLVRNVAVPKTLQTTANPSTVARMFPLGFLETRQLYTHT